MTHGLFIAWLALVQVPASPPVDKTVPSAAVLSDYLARKAKVADTAEARWKFGLWCEQNGLKIEAEEQFLAVVTLDPKRDVAWKHLGYKRHGNRWMTDEQIADEALQIKADKYWLPILRKLHGDLHDKRPERRQNAKAEFLKIREPRAVPALWVALAAGGAGEQELVVKILKEIKGEAASKALAVLALMGKSEDVRQQAAKSLIGRDPLEYAAMLVNLIRKPMKFEVKSIQGAGGVGILLVEGAKYNSRRVYAPPSAPVTEMKPGDLVFYDEQGLAQIHRPGGSSFSAVLVDANGNPYDTFGMQKIKIGENALDAQKAAAVAQAQLENDVEAIEKVNDSIRNSNDRAIAILKVATEKDLGDDAIAWKRWLAELEGKSAGTVVVGKKKQKATLSSFVELAYKPEFSIAQPVICFGAGGISHSGST